MSSQKSLSMHLKSPKRNVIFKDAYQTSQFLGTFYTPPRDELELVFQSNTFGSPTSFDESWTPMLHPQLEAASRRTSMITQQD